MDLQEKLNEAVEMEDYEVACVLRDQIKEEREDQLLRELISRESGVLCERELKLADLRYQYADEVREEVHFRLRKTKKKNFSIIQVVDTRDNTVTFSCDGKPFLTVTYTPHGPKYD